MQNVDINKEVQRAMMSPPQQPRGIIDLLASELKAQDAQAKNKIRAMMAGSPPQDTVLAQNEKTAEDSVRQEIAQKMQAMAVKERQNQARMNRALQGIAAQSAPNMRMMDGGIVGYQAGGNVQTPPKPTMGAVPPSGVGNDQIKQYAEEYMGIKKALENPENAQYKERNQMLLQDLIRQMGDQMPAVMQYIDSMKGIVEPRGFAGPDGSYVAGSPPIFRSEDPELMRYGQGESEQRQGISVVDEILNWAKENPVDAVGLGLMAAPVGGTALSGILAGTARAGRFLAPLARKYGTQAVDKALQTARAMYTRPVTSGIGSAVRGPQGRMVTAQRAQELGLPLNRVFAPGRAMFTAGAGLQAGQGLFNLMSEPENEALEQTDEEVAQEIIATAPPEVAAPTAPAGRTLSREEIDAGSALAREAEMGGPEAARRGASYIATRGGETALVDLANTVAQDATPENMNRFESEIQRLMERRESPIRALSSFLTAFSQARGGSMGQNLAIATTAMRAADDALDNQIIELEKLRRADQISERDFSLKQDELEAQKALIAAQASYYQRMPEVQREVELLRQAGKDIEADRLIRREAVNFAAPMQMVFRTQAERELGRGASETDIQRKATELFEAQVNSYIRVMEGPRARTGTGQAVSPVVQNALDVIGQ